MKTRVHAIAGALCLLTILTFWTSTIISEVFGSYETIAMVKGMILKGMFILIPAMAIVGASGASLGKGRRDALVSAKMKRMPIIAANGLLILVPMAFLLEARASAGTFDGLFYLLQGVELVAGAVNLTLMGLNMRDGIRLSGKGTSQDSVKLTGRETVAEGTMAFHVTKPEGFDHKPGQWIRMTLPNNGGSRVLSIVSAPHEAQLTVATRMTDSAFKRGLKDLPEGAELKIAGPSGNFTLHEDAAGPVVFIAGGIGITPFLSMIRHAAQTNSARNMTLFYSNRDPSAAAFLAELETLAAANPNFQLVATMTGLEAGTSAWSGETGLVDLKMLARYLPDPKAPVYYCVGPAGMVSGTKEMLAGAGIANDRIVVETFTGY
ncbi:FAD-dependent oxidoreductase [uncultured Pelagimonas sp.]|uniref:ferredoxin--NADP reductase n=1 Tax=uncultured Pelagimonas sp. TaxID=1618102 RepID=UPI0026266464|nr:FAD-dependent oxidoreductase [uncultured Pelagimonas sp.]